MAELIMTEKGSTPSTPASTKWKLYFKSTGLFIIDDAGVESGPIGTGSFVPTITSAALGNLVFYDGSAWRNIGGLKHGEMLNGKINVTVASNNITVALKTRSGGDPSATDPVIVNINGTYRLITAALSVTKNAGTNWFGSGSSALATKEIDYFVYLAWNTTPGTDVIDLGFARIPYARTGTEFSTTTTNEKYFAHSNASDLTGTDDVCVIGRFAATLSATASFNWSVPTFTNDNLIQAPILETRVLSWAPTFSASGSMTYGTITVVDAEYQIKGRLVHIELQAHGTTGGTPSNTLIATLPFDCRNATQVIAGAVADGGAYIGGLCATNTGTPNVLQAKRYDAANFTSGSGRYMNVTGDYFI